MSGVKQINSYKKISIALIMLLLLFRLLGTIKVPGISVSVWNYWIVPGLWIMVVILLYTKIPRIHLIGKVRLKVLAYNYAFNGAVAFVVMNILAGLLEGFGKSPYSHTRIGILTNILFVGGALIGKEHIRAYLINTFGRRKQGKAIVAVTLLFFIVNLNFHQISSIQSLEDFATFCGQSLLPQLSESGLATYLVYYGGAWASIIYLGIIVAFEWLSPILPNLSWLMKGIIGMVVPVIIIITLSNHYLKEAKVLKAYRVKEESLWQWVPSAILSVAFIWFVVGVFPVFPSAIATGSMEPMIYPGDVVLVKKLRNQEGVDQLKVGDVIQFKRGNILITHRIIELIQEGEQMSYRTKGDNNASADREVVQPQDLKGTIIKVIPKVGWPTLIFKQDKNVPLEEVEF